MRTMIFAAGLGTRLRPLTDTMPKALVPVAGQPLLAHTLSTLIRQGATESVVNVHHFGEQIIDHLATHPYPIPVHISDERCALLNTGGGLRKALPLFGQEDSTPVLIHNVDILSNADLQAFYERNRQFPATLLVSPRPSTRQLIIREGRLIGWTNLTTGEVKGSLDGEQYAFSGIHLFSPALGAATMSEWPEAFSIMDYYLSICHEVEIHAEVCPDLRLLDVGKADSITQAEQFLSSLNP